LSFNDGDLVSNSVSGFGLPPLISGSQLSLDITNVHGEPNTLPGRDLTVVVRL
jgi:hypothetical protein